MRGIGDMERLGRETLSDVSDEGQIVRARRERLGMTGKALAAEAGVNRNTLAAVEAGDSFNRTTLAKLERALTRLEEEAGIDAPAPAVDDARFVQIELEGVYGIARAVVKGPVDDPDAVARAATELMRQLRAEREAGGFEDESR